MKNKKIDISAENRLLRYCSQQIAPANITYNKLEELLSNNLNWPYVLEESIREGIPCLLYNNLLQFEHKVPENIWASLREIYYVNIYRNTKVYHQMNIILAIFNNENLKVIPLKGVFLAENVYENIALRAMTDIDILIKKEDLTRIDRILENLGYKSPINKKLISHAIKKSYMNSIDYFKTGGRLPTLHIHWHIVNVTLPTYLYTKNIKMARFWETATPVKLQDVETLQLSPEHLIIYLAEHALKHSFDRLILLSDINAVIERYKDQINWEELIKEAKEFGMERQLFYSLYLTKHFLDTDMPDDILSQLTPKKLGMLEQNFLNSVLNNKRNTKLCYFVYLNMVKGTINKLRFIFRTLFPPPSVLALAFNLDKPKVTLKDYLLFLRKQLSHFKNCLTLPKSKHI